MEIKQEKKSFSIKIFCFFIFIGLALFFLKIGLIGEIYRLVTIQSDKNGNKPRDIVKNFIDTVNTGNYKDTERYLTKDSINSINHNSTYNYRFKNYCDQFKGITNAEYTRARPGKSGYCWLIFSGNRGTTDEGYMFYLKMTKNEWFIVENDFIPFYNQVPENQPHSIFKIMPPKTIITLNKSGTAVEKTISIHRIDHDIIKPESFHIDDSDGSVSYRVTIGKHEIVYKEVIENQQIFFVNRIITVKKGFTYILNGSEDSLYSFGQ